jgi:adenylate cyclase
MPLEIERKFLLTNTDWKPQTQRSIVIKQGYLSAVSERTVRVRIADEKGILTIKGKNEGATRAEFEYEIPKEEALELIELCEKPIIEKTRHEVSINNKVWEIDEFEGENQGLVVAEIELESENEKVELPTWIGKEVTDEKKYYNSSLINYPFSFW